MNDSNNSDNLDGVLDADIVALLADASTWVEPPSGLSDRVVAAVRSEAAFGDDSDPVSLGAARRRTWFRPALVGAAAAIT